ncbi:MAG: thioredoxin domain-containing protein [Myxococcales bacterium]|nr:thioredoxin domain-containing protein [Myxococcales bacterium]
MSKGSALVSILFAFFAGVVIGNITAPKQGSEEVADTGADAAPTNEANVKAVEEKDGPERYKVPVDLKLQPSKGPADALITIVEWSDFQCPFCTRVEPTLTQIQKEYGDKVRIVWRNNPLPFHKEAGPAAQVAIEAYKQGGNEKFWAMHKTLFANQKALKREDLEKYATEHKLDMAKVKDVLDNNKHQSEITADQKLGQSLGARGTPAFFINGRFLSGAQPLPRFKEIIDEELKTAEKLVKDGTPKKDLYVALTKNGLTKAAPPAKKPPRRQPDPKAVYKVPVNKSASKGPKDALITIIEFSDFQCPFCTRVNPTVAKIQETYGKDVRIVFKHNALPFHKEAQLAAEASLAARDQGKFWEYHDKLFANQKALKRPDLEKYAQELKLNMAKFKAALDDNRYKAETDEDQKLARSLGASGTPSFFINGRNLRGAQPFEAFKKVIDEELAKAKALAEKGTPKSQLYAKIIENGATSPKFVEGAAADKPAAAKPDANKIYDIPAPKKAPSKGKKGAKVVIQEFSDFQCPFCNRVNPTIKQVLDKYGDKVQIVWRDYPLPFHDKAFKAAEAGKEIYEQAGDEKFWAFHDILFQNQRALDRPQLEGYAQKIGGINMAKFKAALDNDKHKAAVQADMDAVKKAGARIGTPSFFINGKLLQGAQPLPAFEAAIDAALAGK